MELRPGMVLLRNHETVWSGGTLLVVDRIRGCVLEIIGLDKDWVWIKIREQLFGWTAPSSRRPEFREHAWRTSLEIKRKYFTLDYFLTLRSLKLDTVGIMNPGVLKELQIDKFAGLNLLLRFGSGEGNVQISIPDLSGSCTPAFPCLLDGIPARKVEREVALAGVDYFPFGHMWPLINKAILSCATNEYQS